MAALTSEAKGCQSLPLFRKDMITLEVGPDKVELYIHRHVAERSSKFIQAALKKEWQQGRNNVVDLSDYSVDHIEYYSKWLYACVGQGGRPILRVTDMVVLAKLYVVGEKLQDRKFQGTIMDAIDEKRGFSDVPASVEAMEIIYANTLPGSPTRKAMVQQFICKARPDALDSVNNEFMGDIAREMLRTAARPHNSRHLPMHMLKNASTDMRMFESDEEEG